jgi:hypothetical protein
MGRMQIAVSGAALALAAALAAGAPAYAMTAPKAVTHGEASWVSGGIGSAEVAAIKSEAPGFPLALTFAQHSQGRNEYVAGVKLRVTDRSGHTVADLQDGGPLVLLKLPDGSYTLEAEYNGKVETRRVTVSAGHHQKIGFLWS